MNKIERSTVTTLFELYKGGDFKTLAERARSLLVSHPDEWVLHSLLGSACLELEEYDAARKSYQAALAIKSDFAKAHNSLGIVYLSLNQLEGAAESFRNAVKLDPQFVEACFNLGIVYENLQRWGDAAACYKKAMTQNPNHYKASSSLARVLWESGEYDQVAEHYERALAVKEDYLPAHRDLMQFLEQSGQHEKLRDAISRAAKALGKRHILARLYQGVMADIDKEHEKARTLLERIHIEPVDPLSMYDERLRLARLTRICDKLNDTDAVMQYAQEANHLSSEMSTRKGIHKETFLGFVENRRRYFTRDNVRQWRTGTRAAQREARDNPAPDLEYPVFIIGFPRSGTTLIDTILRGHPSIEVAEEIDAVPGMVNRIAGLHDERLAGLAALSNSDIQALRTVYFDALTRRVQPKDDHSRLIDRFAINIIYLGEIYRVFPNARFILALRHPADCVLSCFMQTFHETSANASFHTLQDAAYLYDQVFSLWRQHVEILNPNLLRMKYEDLISDVEKACQALLDFIRLPWHPAVLDHERTARDRSFIRTASYNQVIQPLYSEANGRWLRYRDQMQPIMPILKPWIRYFGYE